MPQPTYSFVRGTRTNGTIDNLDGKAGAGDSGECEGLYRLCRPSQWTISVPTTGPDAVTGLECNTQTLRVSRGGSLVHNGIIRRVRYKGDGEKASAIITSLDPLCWLPWRMLRDSTGNYAKPEFFDPITVGELLFEALANAETFDGGGGYDLGMTAGSDTTTANVYSALSNFPLTIGWLASMLAGTAMGEWYIDPTAVGSSTSLGDLNVADRFGTDVSGSVEFGYGPTTANNCDSAEYDEDGSKQITALRYLLGPKLDDEHWRGSVDPAIGGSPLMPDPPESDILALMAAQRAAIGFWHDVRVFDDAGLVEDEVAPLSTERIMFRRMFQLEFSLRLRPKRLVFATPNAELGPKPWDDFFLGDWVSTDVSGLGVSVSGVQRVYGFAVKPDRDGIEHMGPVISSADAEEVVG